VAAVEHRAFCSGEDNGWHKNMSVTGAKFSWLKMFAGEKFGEFSKKKIVRKFWS
jgi:hypothetical protein